MFTKTLEWKEFNLNLSDVEAWLRTNCGPLYVGNSADSSFRLHFSDDPGETIKVMCQQYWDALTAESPEATSYVSRTQIDAAIANLKANLYTKSWDQMSVAERKIVTGQTPTKQELGL